jgi:2'-hydroxyisoflavone reductase
MIASSSRRRFMLGSTAAAAFAWASGCEHRSTAPTTSSPEPGPPAPLPELGKTKPSGKLRLLVLGGTGFIGPHIVEAAQAKGWEVTLFNRGKTRPELFPEVEKLQGDRDGKLDALKGRQWDAVIDNSGYVPRIVRDSASLLADNVGQYVFVSSISAYAESTYGSPGITEADVVATMPDPTNERVEEFYGALKALCEQAAETAMPGRVTNVRPGFIVGPGDPSDRFTYWPLRVEKGGEMVAPGTPGDPVQYIDARDLAAWMIGAVEHEHFGVYNLCGPVEPTSIGALIQTCIEVTGSDAKPIWIDATFLGEHGAELGGDLPIWVPDDDKMRGFARVSNAKAVATGLVTRPTAEIVADTLKWFHGLPEPRQKTLRAGWIPQREAEMLVAFHKRDGGKQRKAKPKPKPKPKKTAMRPARRQTSFG